MSEPSNPKKKWLIPTAALLVVGLAWLVLRLIFPPFRPPVLPVPNGYDDLLRAAKMLAPRTGYYEEMGDEELAAVVEENARALNLAREALQKDCRVIVNWTAGPAELETQMDSGSSLREIARAFAAAARWAGIDGMLDQGVVCGLDTLDLARATGRGGLIVDRMVAQAIQRRAFQVLRDLGDQLSSEDCTRLRKRIELFSLQLDSPEEVLQRERVFFRQINGTLQSIMMSGVSRTQLKQVALEIETADKRLATLSALLRTHLALRAFQLDSKRLPNKLDELVPDFLREVPQDRFSASSLIYRPLADDDYRLYSVGPDGVDGGGVQADARGQRVDLLLEVGD